MNINTISIALVALVLGLGGGYAIAAASLPDRDEHMMSNGMMMHNNNMGMGGAMDEMMQGIDGKTGDAFDRAFLSEMIMHHEGAVQMAEAALRNAKHEEVQNMAHAIIAAQTTEINQMKAWQAAWYGQSY